MKRLGQTVIGAAGLGVALLSSQASAAPTCTGSTTTITSPATVQDSFLVNAAGQTNGNCVAAGDKLYGNFTFGTAGNQLPFDGQIAQFDFPNLSPNVGNYQISFSTNLNASTASQFGYEVMTTNAAVALIDDFQKDASFNGVTGSTISLTGSINGAQLINCTRTLGGAATCPQIVSFTPIQDVVVRENATAGAGAIITNVTDTISQIATATPAPEPASLALLGSALVGFGVVVRRRRKAA